MNKKCYWAKIRTANSLSKKGSFTAFAWGGVVKRNTNNVSDVWKCLPHFYIISKLKPNKLTKPPDANKLTNYVIKTLNIQSCEDLKDIMKKQLLAYKRIQELRTGGNNVVHSNDMNWQNHLRRLEYLHPNNIKT